MQVANMDKNEDRNEHGHFGAIRSTNRNLRLQQRETETQTNKILLRCLFVASLRAFSLSLLLLCGFVHEKTARERKRERESKRKSARETGDTQRHTERKSCFFSVYFFLVRVQEQTQTQKQKQVQTQTQKQK